ncbi:MAG TPA: cytochrome c-type biogenesis CcmF C-terminal domain-containing protein, partial [Thermoanaerobaculia bacterium]|nr:cytochrome c-type biogenesis CcmF C-terminal domain-containing protein [Thermoanaerobaculia bacterium]
WGRATREQMKRALLPPIAGGVVLALLGYVAGVRAPWTLLTLAFGGYAAQVTFAEMFLPTLQRMKRGESAGSAFVDAQLRRGRRRFASYVVHAAVLVAIIAIAVSSSMRQATEMHFTKGQTQQVSGFDVTFLGVEQQSEPHRSSLIARFGIARNGKSVATLAPRMSQYRTMREPIGAPDVYTTLAGDFYISLANIDPVSQSASINVYTAPLVVWIWISVICMGLGGLAGLIPRGATGALARRPTTEAVVATQEQSA